MNEAEMTILNEKKSKTLLEQVLSYRFINNGVSLHEILKDIDLDSIVLMDISEIEPKDIEDSDYWHLWDYEDLPLLINNFMNLKLVIDRFIKEKLNLSEFFITEQPLYDSYVIQGTEHEEGIEMIIQDGVAEPYYVDNHTDLPYNNFKANTIIEAFEKINF